MGVYLLDHFRDPKAFRLDKKEWDDQYGNKNVVIHSESDEITYPKHWGPLSIKCAFRGEEFYVRDYCVFAVNENNFLILNADSQYSSFVPAGGKVESFTINFNSEFVSAQSSSLNTDITRMLDDPFFSKTNEPRFVEKLYGHNDLMLPHLSKVRSLTKNFPHNAHRIEEELSFLFEGLLVIHNRVAKEISDMHLKRKSTREEIYRRVHNAKDYMDSCYSMDISLEKLASIACMSPHHLLRQFKKLFKITPHQFLIKRRMEAARRLLTRSSMTMTEICNMVGFEDISSFVKLFKKYYGLPPITYRRLQTGKPMSDV